MSDPEFNDPSPRSVRHLIDSLADQFEESLAAGEAPEIDPLLQQVGQPFRQSLFVELLALLKHYAQQNNQPFDAEGLSIRYPQYHDLIRCSAEASAPGLADLTEQPDPNQTIAPSSGRVNQTGGTQDWQPGSTVNYFGDYELIEEIARGGMGVVFKARQTTLNRIVAIKMILAGQLAGEAEVQRFYMEAEAAASLDHPGIVPVYEVGLYEGQHYFSMGFVEGHSLSDRLSDGPLPAKEAAELAMKTAQAIEYAHSKGVIHRDLKPANVLIDANGEPKVTDFGLAKQVNHGSDLTATGQVLGTPSYMPPEQASGIADQITERADIYSLGGILYALLTGRPPFQAASTFDTLMQVIEKEPVPPRQLDSNIPRDLETIALKALDKTPARRYESAEDFADDLQRYLNGEPINARAISRVERTWRLAKRKPLVASLVGLATLLAMTILIGAPMFAVREGRLRSQADEQKSAAEVAKGEALTAQSLAEHAQTDAESARDDLADQKETADRKLYSRTMSLAYQQWLDNNVYRTESLLDKTETRFRDWEWHFLKQLCRSEEQTLSGHAGTPFRVQPVDDGKHLVSIGLATSDPQVYVWDLELGLVIQKYPYRAFAISKDGRHVALEKKNDGPVHVVEVFSGKTLIELPTHGGGTAFADFNSDGTRLVTTGPDKFIRIWDLDRQDTPVKPTVETKVEIRDNFHAPISFSSEDRYVYWKTMGGKIQMYDTAVGKLKRELFDPIYRRDAHRVSMSRDHEILAAASDGPINLFDAQTGDKIGALLGHEGSVLGLDFSPDGKRLVSSGTDGTVRIWDLAGRREIFRYRGHKFGNYYGVPEVIYSRDGSSIISAGTDATIKIWSANASDPYPPKPDNSMSTRLLRMMPRGNDLYMSMRSKPFPDPSQECNWLTGHDAGINSVEFSKDGKFAVTAGGNDVIVHDLTTRESTFKFTRHQGYGGQSTTALAIHPNGDLIASGERQNPRTRQSKIFLWDRTTGKVLHTLRKIDRDVTELKFSPDGTRLFATGGDERDLSRGELTIWDVSSGEQVAKNDSVRGVNDFDISSDGKLIAVAARGNGQIELLDANSAETIKAISAKNFHSVEFSPDGSRLVTNNHWAIAVYDVETGNQIWEESEHTGRVSGVAFFPNGKRIASVSIDNTTKVWDAETGNVLVDFKGDAFYLHNVSISPDGRHLASFGEAPYVTLRSLDPRFASLGELADSFEWQTIFEEDFENDSHQVDQFFGSGEIQNGVFHLTLGAVEGQPNFFAATMIPNVQLPSIVEIEYDVWAPQGLTIETKLHNELVSNGMGAAAVSNGSWLNQGREGMSIFFQASGAFSEKANVNRPDWFTPNQKYRMRLVRNRGSLQLFIDGVSVLESNVPEQMWVPNLHIQGSFGKPGDEFFIDNLVIRAPASVRHEIDAAELVGKLRKKLKLNGFVINAIGSTPDVEENVRQLATRYVKLSLETSESRKNILREEVVNESISPSAFKSLIPFLKDDLKISEPHDWDIRLLLGAVYYRAGETESAIELLAEVDEIYKRQFFLPNPISKAILGMCYSRIGENKNAMHEMHQLNEQMRSEYWLAKPDIVAWQTRAVNKVSLLKPKDAAVANDIEEIKRLTFELQQQGVCHHDLDEYLDLFTDDAVQVDGRTASPNEFDIEKPMAVWKKAIRIFRQSPSMPEAYLIRGNADVEIDGDEATLKGTYQYLIPRFAWVWQSEEKLRRTKDGWKIYHRRHGVVGRRNLGEMMITSEDDWQRLDRVAESMLESGDERAAVTALGDAMQFEKAFELAKKVAAKGDAGASDWIQVAGHAFSVCDPEEMVRAGKKAVQLNPLSDGLPFLRAIATREHLGDPEDLGHDITVTSPTFFKTVDLNDLGYYRDLPGTVLKGWFPTDTSAVVIFVTPKSELEKSAEEEFNEMITFMKMAFTAEAIRSQKVEVQGRKANEVIFKGKGGGRQFVQQQNYDAETMQRWIAIEREQDVVSIILSCRDYEFGSRNAEFECFLDRIQISPSVD